MCLVLTGWRAHPEYRLIVAANRDEFYTRPTESMRWWPEVTGLLAGRDLGASGAIPGTWLGLSRAESRFATVTNVRGPRENRPDARSRGALLMDFLRGEAGPEKFVRATAAAADEYNGYNLMISDLETLWWHSNRSALTPLELTPGLHGISNGALLASVDPLGDTAVCPAGPEEAACVTTQGPRNHRHEAAIHTDTGAPAWPKVREGLGGLRAVIAADPGDVDGYFAVLADRTPARDDELPDTGLSPSRERAVSSRFIASTLHGTRCSTVLLVREDGSFEIAERSFARLGDPTGEVSFTGRLRLPA
ncbi:NRDE family protein [Nocardia sp. NEAU-G5]|uniref:NRDE family protein n=1 Tax=Nocardia albiluteola TaxID=2842303 RepID=A0ABS6B778_9NOCA|nr:NRDE family protein [Nocardia albiluteola]MBU3066168.1 NRDE family protein [Nocardia albiluteola]